MFATAGGPSFAGRPLTWNLFFARQPEPDLEFTEEELEQTMNVRSSPPMKSPKKSGGSPFLWILLLTVIGGGAYVAMEPEMVMDVVGPLLGETPEPPPPPVARKPAPPKPAPSTLPRQPEQIAPAPIEPPTQPLGAAVPEPTATPAPSMPTASVAATPAPKSPTASTAIAPPTEAVPDPLFAEGQRVTVLPNAGAPRQKVSLMKDAEGTKPGPAIPPGTAFTILDGDLQDQGWVYHVQSDYGTKGWLKEKQLKRKP